LCRALHRPLDTCAEPNQAMLARFRSVMHGPAESCCLGTLLAHGGPGNCNGLATDPLLLPTVLIMDLPRTEVKAGWWVNSKFALGTIRLTDRVSQATDGLGRRSCSETRTLLKARSRPARHAR
jgi:hypothetical protein